MWIPGHSLSLEVPKVPVIRLTKAEHTQVPESPLSCHSTEAMATLVSSFQC